MSTLSSAARTGLKIALRIGVRELTGIVSGITKLIVTPCNPKFPIAVPSWLARLFE